MMDVFCLLPFSITVNIDNPFQMNYTAAELRGIKKESLLFRCKQRRIKLIYPDTLRYRDSFNLQISMRYVFEI
jgi:hypothetical protein